MNGVKTGIYFALCIGIVLVSGNFSHAGIDAKSIVGLWLFDEVGDDVAIDSSENELDGIIEGDAKWDDGVFGKALEFDGVGVRVVVPSIGTMKKESGSILLWVNPDFTVDDGATYGQIGIAGFYGDGLGAKDEKCHQIFKWGGNNNWFFRVGFDDPNDGVGANQFATPDNLMPEGEWTHVAMTWEKDGQSIVYINGDKAGTMSANTKTLTEWKREEIFIGTSWSDNKHKGMIDDVGLFNAVLSQDDIKGVMARGLSDALAVDSMGKIAATWGSIKGKL